VERLLRELYGYRDQLDRRLDQLTSLAAGDAVRLIRVSLRPAIERADRLIRTREADPP